jgi:hypothetical protein
VRYLLVDDDRHVSLNHSSILTNVFTSNPDIAQVSLVPQSTGEYLLDQDGSRGDGMYEKRLVKFFNITGTVDIIASAQYYLKDSFGVQG